MKKSIYKISKILMISALGVGLFVTSCKKDFDRINTDPNNPTAVPNGYYLAGAQRGIMDNTCDIWWGGNVGNQLAQYWASNQYTSESRYQFRTAITNGYWGLFYAGGLSDVNVQEGGLLELQAIIDVCKSDPGAASAYGDPDNQIAVATILKAWLTQNMTDAWGEIPYSQALDPKTTRTPVYDEQSEIYNTLINEVNEALALINTNEGPDGDLIYAGDMQKWARFGNALKMRLAIRIADVNPGLAQTTFNQAAAAGTFTSNADNALLRYEGGSSANPVYYNYAIDKRNDYAASNTFLDSTLLPLNDPRLTAFFAPATASGLWKGEVYGLSEANAAATPNSSVSQRSNLILSATLPGIYMDYAQVLFMQAEAAERGWGGTAAGFYNNAIAASIEFWTTLNGAPAPLDTIQAYIDQDSVKYDIVKAASGWKYAIGRQKWIALCNQGIQGWTEWRRLDFGILKEPADGVLQGTGIPYRMEYALDEQTLNGANYNAAVNRQGPDLYQTKLWWDIY